MPPLCESESPYMPATDCEILPRAGFLSHLFSKKVRQRGGEIILEFVV